MACRSTLTLCALFSVALLIFIATATIRPAHATSSPQPHKAASTCCCCAPRNKLPVTKSVYFKTKTVTVIKTVTSKKKLAARKDSSENYDHPSPVSEVAQDTDLLDSAASAGPLHSLFARHLCPVCPSGVSILPATKAAAAGAKKNAGSFNYCCPKRKTLTKTIKKTLTKRKTRTTTVAPRATIKGRVYYDLNKNDVYEVGIDKPIANTVIVLVNAVAKASSARSAARALPPVLGRTRTDSEGNFVMTFDKQSPGVDLNVVKDSERFKPLIAFTTNADGGADVNVPVIRPKSIAVIPPPALEANKATVNGKNGISGHTIYLYSDNVIVGSTTVSSDGTFTVKSSAKLKSGKHQLAITQADEYNAESESVPAGSVTVIAPPVVTSTSLSVNVATLKGTGQPGAKIVLWAGDLYVGATIVDQSGAFTVSSIGLDIGTFQMSVTQSDDSGDSDHANGDSVTIKAPRPADPVVTSTELVDKTVATVKGTGEKGATIKLYVDGIYSGNSVVVANDGTFTVSSSSLAPGTHLLSITQTVASSGATSDSVDAGSVTVVGPATTTVPVVPPQETTAPAPGQQTTVPGGGQQTTAPSAQQTTAPSGQQTTAPAPAGQTTTAGAPPAQTTAPIPVTTTQSETETQTRTTTETQTETSTSATPTTTAPPLWPIVGYGNGATPINGKTFATDLDSQGNVYLAGAQLGTPSITIGSTTYPGSGAACDRPILIKQDPKGYVLWSVVGVNQTGSGVCGTVIRAIAVDASDNVWIAGDVMNTVTYFADQQLQGNGSWADVFIMKLNGTDGSFMFYDHVIGDQQDSAFGITLDSDGKVYLAGTYMTNPTQFGSIYVARVGGRDPIVAKHDGTTVGGWLWAKNLGSSSSDSTARQIIVSNSKVYVSGGYAGNINLNGTTFNELSGDGDYDIWVAALSTADGTIQASNIFRGARNDEPYNMALGCGHLFLGGAFSSSNLQIGSVTLARVASTDGWIAMLEDTTLGVQDAMGFGGDGNDWVMGMAYNTGSSTLYVGGYSSSSYGNGFTFGASNVSLASGAFGLRTFIGKISVSGNTMTRVDAVTPGGSVAGKDGEGVYSMKIDSTTGAVFSAISSWADWSFGTDSWTKTGGFDMLLVKVNSDLSPAYT